MQTGNIDLQKFLFHRKVQEIEVGRCECRQGNQPVKQVLLEYRLFALQRHNLGTEEARSMRKEKRRSLDIERILMDSSGAKKASILINKIELTDWSFTFPWRKTNIIRRRPGQMSRRLPLRHSQI